MPRPPKENPQHRGPRVGPQKLPAEGRKGEPPAWPLPGDPTADEKAAWVDLWGTPHAVAWASLGWTRTVARYCRLMVRCEDPEASAALLAAATAMEDRLGLTPKAMRLLLWSIVEDETAEKRSTRSPDRKRLRAVDTSGA